MLGGLPMTRIVRLSPSFAVAGQLTAADFDEIAAQGFKSVIANRPDGEHPDQLSAAETEQLAMERGMAFRYLPLVMSIVLDPATSAATQAAIDEMPGPVLAFCRSGTRSIVTWSIGQARAGAPRDELARLGADAGYDLSSVLGV